MIDTSERETNKSTRFRQKASSLDRATTMMESPPKSGNSAGIKPNRSTFALHIWKTVFALVAVVDLYNYLPLLSHGWKTGLPKRKKPRNQQPPAIYTAAHLFRIASSQHDGEKDDEEEEHYECNVANDDANDNRICVPGSENKPLLNLINGVFWFMCAMEALMQARRAYRRAYEGAALRSLEKTLAQTYIKTRRRLTRAYKSTRNLLVAVEQEEEAQQATSPLARRQAFFHYAESDDQSLEDSIDLILQNTTLRLWMPVIVVLSLWALLLPIAVFVHTTKHHQTDDHCIAHVALAKISMILRDLMDYSKRELFSLLRRRVIFPFVSPLHPRHLVGRIRTVLRWVRYFRFAQPLVRMIKKVFDQIDALARTWRQELVAKAERAKRLARRSLLLQDIDRLEARSKENAELARVPFEVIQAAQNHLEARGGRSEVANVGALLAEKKQESDKLTRYVRRLKDQVRRTSVTSSDLYDTVVRLSREISVCSGTSTGTCVSGEHLIPPNTRFVEGWRIVMALCLLQELVRLYVSWQLSREFQLETSDIASRLIEAHVGQCPTLIADEHTGFLHALRRSVMGPSELYKAFNADETTCVEEYDSISAFLVYYLSYGVDIFVDIVCSLDIFVWYYTGDLDHRGSVVPKSFFSRFILPGTVSQVMDHPTMPETMTNIAMSAVGAAHAVGFGRTIRWGMVLVPLIRNMFKPVKEYLMQAPHASKPLLKTRPSVLFEEMKRKTAPSLEGLPESASSSVSEEGLNLNPFTLLAAAPQER